MNRIVILAVIISLAVSIKTRTKRQAYNFPDGVELIVGSVRGNFFCSRDGYYADVENNCQIFHVCNTIERPGEQPEIQQWSFFCGNQTVFDQFSLTCAFPEEAIPCENSADFFYLNERLGNPAAFLHDDQDVQRKEALLANRRPGIRVNELSPHRGRPF